MEQARKQQIVARGRVRSINVSKRKGTRKMPCEGGATIVAQPALPLGTRVRIGEDVRLELSQIGKVCHTKCAIYHLAGDCIFPREGIFFVALEGGAINVGDPVEVVSLGDGTCAYTPPEALAELAAATR